MSSAGISTRDEMPNPSLKFHPPCEDDQASRKPEGTLQTHPGVPRRCIAFLGIALKDDQVFHHKNHSSTESKNMRR